MEENYNLKKTRKELGMTQEDLAKAIGIGGSIYHSIERGKIIPVPEVQKKISEYFVLRGYSLLEEDLFPIRGNDAYDLGKKVSLLEAEIEPVYSTIENKISQDHIIQVIKDLYKDRIDWQARKFPRHEKQTIRNEKIFFSFYGIGEEKEKDVEELAKEYGLSKERIRQIIEKETRICKHKKKTRDPILNGEDFKSWYN